LLAGIDLLTGQVHALVKDRHRSREFIEFLNLLDAAYPSHTAIKLILDNHSAHISKETRAWLAKQPAGLRSRHRSRRPRRNDAWSPHANRGICASLWLIMLTSRSVAAA
jgi:hypothetical protein